MSAAAAIVIDLPDAPDGDATETFDPAVLERATYLTSHEAAFYLGYRAPKYRNPRHAFMTFAKRVGSRRLPQLIEGRRRLFARKDLDALFSRKKG